jgi:hypothetical protein
MLKYRDKITHVPQAGEGNCGPVALKCLFNNSLHEIEEMVKCDSKGTNVYNVISALQYSKIDYSFVPLHSDHQNHFWWLEIVSHRFPIYLCCHFINQGPRGRPSNSHHAILLANGLCYDGNFHREMPIESILQNFNKKFLTTNAIIFHKELPKWSKSLSPN